MSHNLNVLTENGWIEATFSPEQRLFIALVRVMLADTCNTRNPRQRQDALDWFRSKSFAQWCELVGVEPTIMQHAITRLSPHPTTAPPIP
jgi:hypothetical protein